MFSSVPRKYAFGNSQLYVYFHLCIQTKDSGYSKKFRVNIALEQLEVDRFEKNHLIGNFEIRETTTQICHKRGTTKETLSLSTQKCYATMYYLPRRSQCTM